MAYCKNCGAYVPDGHTKCLACGLSQEEEKNYGSGSASQADPREASRDNNEQLRRRLEEQRRKQQEENRRWAEAERSRRTQQEEQRRRQDEYQTSQWKGDVSQAPNKLLASLSYLWILFILPFVFAKEDKFALFHAKQGALLFFSAALGQVLGSIVGLGWLVTLMQLYLIYKGMTTASTGKMEALPYIGHVLDKQD